MAIDASIISQGIKPIEPVDPMAIQARVFGLRNLQQQSQLGALELQQKQKAISDEQTMNRIMQGAYGQSPSQQPGFTGPTQPGQPPAGGAAGLPPGVTKGADGVFTLDPGYLTKAMAAAGIADKIPGTLSSLADYQEKAATLAKTRGDVALQTRDALGALAATIDAAGGTPAAFHMGALMAVHNGQVTLAQVQPYLDRVDADPTQVGAITKELQAGSPKQTELASAKTTADARKAASDTGAARLALETPDIQARTAKTQAEVAGTLPMTAAQKAQNDLGRANLAVSQGRLNEEKQKNARAANPFGALGTTATVTAPAGTAATPTTDATPAGLNTGALDGLSKGVAFQVKALAEGRMPFPSGMALKTDYWQGMLQKVAEYDPSFDAVNYNARSKTRSDFTSGKSSQQVNALNTVVGHMQSLADAADALDNSRFSTYNTVANAIANQAGDPRIKRFNTVKTAVTDELTRVWRQSGGTEADIKAWGENLDAASSPAQLHGVIAQMGDLLESKIGAMQTQYEQGMGTNGVQMMTPAARKTLDALKGGGAAAPAVVADGAQQPIPGIAGGVAEYRGGKWVRVK